MFDERRNLSGLLDLIESPYSSINHFFFPSIMSSIWFTFVAAQI